MKLQTRYKHAYPVETGIAIKLVGAGPRACPFGVKERVRNSLTWERRRPACAPGYIKMGKLFKTRS